MNGAGGWNNPGGVVPTTGRTPTGGFVNSAVERPPDHVLYGGRPYGRFVNSAVMLDILQFVNKSRDMLRHGNVHVVPLLSLTVMKT